MRMEIQGMCRYGTRVAPLAAVAPLMAAVSVCQHEEIGSHDQQHERENGNVWRKQAASAYKRDNFCK